MSAPTNKIAAQWLHPIPAPEPHLTPAEMIRRAEALRPLLRERQAQTERNGNMSADTHAELVKAGFYRVLQPRRFGGYEFDFPTYIRVMMAIARGCPETAWVLSIVAGHVGQLASFPIEAQREVYGADGEVRSPEVTAPPGVATPVEGGYLLTGAWDYASGSEYSTHLIVVARVANDQGNADNRTLDNRTIMALVDRADYTIEKNWHVFGMQGTGSDRVVLNKVFVPDYRTKPVFLDGTRVMPDRDYYSNPMYFGPYRAYVIAESTAVIVGGAEGALDCYEEDFRNRKVAFPTGMYRYELAEFQLNFGRCRALIDTAKAALIQVAEQYMAAAQAVYAGEQLEPQLERRLCMIEQQTIHLACEAVDIMFRTAGSTNAKHDSMLGRYWRNLSVARGHLAHQSDTSAINFGRAYFGLPTVGIG